MPDLPPPPEAARSSAPAFVAVWSRWRQRLSPLAAAGGGLLAVVVVGSIGWAAWRGGTGPPPELTLPTAAPGPSAPDRAGSEAGGSDRTGPVIVHVAGAVARPGVYRLAAGARVSDALEAAGGPVAGADVDALNLAAKVGDGERIFVPREGEAPEPGPVDAPGSPGGAPLDLNTATAAQLEGLPGVGPSTAAAIVAYRTEHGRFTRVDDLLEVRGIGEAKLAAIRSKVRVR